MGFSIYYCKADPPSKKKGGGPPFTIVDVTLAGCFISWNILLKYIKTDDNWGYPMDWKPPHLVFEGLIRPIPHVEPRNTLPASQMLWAASPNRYSSRPCSSCSSRCIAPYHLYSPGLWFARIPASIFLEAVLGKKNTSNYTFPLRKVGWTMGKQKT